MQFFKFWTKAKRSAQGSVGTFDVSCFGYSNESLDHALQVAEERARVTAQALAEGRQHDSGYYGNSHPLREEIVEEFLDEGELTAIISRNHYGCLILNSPNVVFADIDKPESEQQSNGANAILNLFGSFFGAEAEKPKSFEQSLIDNIDQHCSRNRNLGLRLYRTTNGYRAVITNEPISAGDSRSRELLQSLGSDRLYIALCKSQDCYRARLTPKPWRCGSNRPPYRFPFDSESQVQTFRQWESDYESTIKGYATCALIGQFGSDHIDPSVDKILQLHDHYVLNGDKPIA